MQNNQSKTDNLTIYIDPVILDLGFFKLYTDITDSSTIHIPFNLISTGIVILVFNHTKRFH